jgi:hypothetical protein
MEQPLKFDPQWLWVFIMERQIYFAEFGKSEPFLLHFRQAEKQ